MNEMQKRRDMRRTDWKRILKRDYVWDTCSYLGMEGISSLILIHKITEPLTVRNGDHDVTIVEEGLSWLQIAFRDQYIWVTAMFDQQDRLLQIYFDITDGNHLEPVENPIFDDMYLDIVMEPDGMLYVLDRDELDEAYQTKKISPEQYERTLREGERLFAWLEKNAQAFADFCCRQRMKLKGMQKNGQAGAR